MTAAYSTSLLTLQSFLDLWFTVSESTDPCNEIAVYGKTKAGKPNSISLTLSHWDKLLNEESLHTLVNKEFDRPAARLYPRLVGRSKFAGSLAEDYRYVDTDTRDTGMWVDLPPMKRADLGALISYLDGGRYTIPIPTAVTGITGSDALVIDARMWWRLPDVTNVSPGIYTHRNRGWARKVQAVVNDLIGMSALSIPNWVTTLDEMSCVLPGVDEYRIIWRDPIHSDIGSDGKFLSDKLAMDNYNAYKEMIAQLENPDGDAVEAAQIEHLPWDVILGPAGWRSTGIVSGGNPHVNYWMAPGVSKTSAVTDSKILRLMQPDWLTGLKEASDLGIPLNKWNVAALLAWDGDGAAQSAHYRKTGRFF